VVNKAETGWYRGAFKLSPLIDRGRKLFYFVALLSMPSISAGIEEGGGVVEADLGDLKCFKLSEINMVKCGTVSFTILCNRWHNF